MSQPNKIDVHHHVYPPFYSQAIEAAGGDPSGWFIPPWTLSSDHSINQLTNTRTAILSITAHGPSIAGNAKDSAALARACNEYCAKIRDDDPKGYGFFACLPDILDHQSESLAEIAYAFDVLHADGIVLYTRYGSGHTYLGHPDLVPVWQELNRRKAVVFIHPTHAVDTQLVNHMLAAPLFDYPHETGRTAIDLILQRRTSQFPDVKIILSHAGGTLLSLIERVAGLFPPSPMSEGLQPKMTKEEIEREARRFYYDTALSGNKEAVDLVRRFAGDDHILFGSDFPNAPTEGINLFTRTLEGLDLDDDVKEKVYFRNAQRLFPRLLR